MNISTEAGEMQAEHMHVPFHQWQKLDCLSLSNRTLGVLWLDLISSYLLDQAKGWA